MDKRQQWIVTGIVALVALGIGTVVYRQFTLTPTGTSSSGGAFGAVPLEKATTTSVPTVVDSIPAGDVSPEDVVKGIAGDLSKEEASAEDETTVEKDAATAGVKALNEYENTYEENNL